MYRADTIVACATAPGRAAIAVLRMSGPEAFSIADRILVPSRARSARPWQLARNTAVDPSTGEALDDVLAVRMPAPRTYTGEDVVEIHCHGSPLVVERILAASTRSGARQAERGEFTRRAVLNGRMDLVQAESVADLIDARVAGGARAAWAQIQGALSQRLGELRERLVAVLADLEANVDFSDDELPAEDDGARMARLCAVDDEMQRLLNGFEAARRWREGERVVFAGRPNVGKSSLVNALLGYGRMIVSAEPGTTRDSVEEVVDLDGAAFVLTDTAGIRTTPSDAEAQAVDRARQKLEDGDLVLVVLDASQPLSDDDRAIVDLARAQRCLVVLNKVDLPRAVSIAEVRTRLATNVPVIEASARTGVGCSDVAAALREAAQPVGSDQTAPSVSRLRHRTALEQSQARVRSALGVLRNDGPAELVSVELRDALSELAAITDPVDNEDVLDRIFAEFCIGK